MIIIERTITIKNDQATLDSPIYLYRGDGDIVCLFTIKEMKKAATFGKIEANNPVSQASYGNVRIYKPDGSKCVFTEKSPIVDDKLQVTFSYENINDFTEVGVHKLQIHLYDDNDAHNESNDKNRFTLPPVDINVLLPVGDDNNQIDEAVVGYSLLNAVDEEVPAFDEEGNYNKTIWQTGDIITQGKLNKIEDALYEISTADDNYVTNEVLEAELDNIEIALNGKANASHAHKEYATTNHNHTNYATRTDLNNKANTNHTHSNYATRDELSNKANTNHTHSEYATKEELPKVPTKVSDLFNDKEYITRADIPSSYVTESELSSYGYVTENYVNGNFANQDYVKAEIAKAQLGGGGDGSVDLSGFALKSDIPTSTAQLYNNSGFITEKALEGYATTTYVSDTIDNRLENVNIDLSNYPTNDDMNNALSNKAEAIHEHPQYATTDHTHEDYALKTEIPDMVTVPTNVSAFTNDAGYITDEAVTPKNEAIDKINEELESRAKITDIPTIPTNVSAFENDKGYALKTDIPTVPTKLSELENDKDYALKTDIPTKVVDLEDHEDYATNASVSEAINTINRNIEDNYATKGEIPTTTEQLTNDSGYITSNSVIRIEIVTELPETEEPGVLYIVKA